MVQALVHVTILVATNVRSDLGGLNLTSPEQYSVSGAFALANLRTWYFDSIAVELMKCIYTFFSFPVPLDSLGPTTLSV